MMKTHYKFNPSTLAEETGNAYSADRYNSWKSLATLLADRNFNAWEAEAILRSKWTRWAADKFHTGSRKPSSSCLGKYLDHYGYTTRHPEVNRLVLETFDELVADENGVPCREGTMPGNPEGGRIKVPVGTPLSCDPTSETYWSS
jgi:hypothetical protein